jgi:ubiquinone/menaquinone biosynthesis C-methylase UbiE
VKRLSNVQELLDGPLDPDLLDGNLRDLARVNRWLGGIALSRRALVALLRGHPGHVELLDVGTGAADIPDALVEWLARRRRHLLVTAVDTRPEILAAARRRIGDRVGLKLELVSGDRLPHDDGAFDVAHCSLVLHHLDPGQAHRLLTEMARVSRLGIIVNDLDRGWLTWVGAWLLGRLATRNPYTRHDGPLSVRRAYRAAEVAQMATRAGLVETARFHDVFRHRYSICLVRAPTSAGADENG